MKDYFIICLLCIVSNCLNLSYKAGAQEYSGFDSDRRVLVESDLKSRKDTLGIKVVSASRSAKYLSDLPFTMYVVTHEEIKRNNYVTLIDVLKSIPSVRTSQPGSGELGEGFQIRGQTGNFYTKILINNIPIKPSVVKGMPIGAQLPVRQAERIEIIFGPAAAVYGADAVSGVINIITKDASQGTFVRGDISFGINEYRYFNFMVGGKAGKNKRILQYSFYGSRAEMNDMNIGYKDEEVYNPLNYLNTLREDVEINGIVHNTLDVTPGLFDSDSSINNFIQKYYPENYDGKLDYPKMQELLSQSHMIGVDLKYRGLSLTYNSMYRRTHSSIGRSPFLYQYNNPQNFWGEIIHGVGMGYTKDWARLSTSTNLYTLSYFMDNNSSVGLTFYPGREKLYRYSESHDFLIEQLFNLSPMKNMEIVSGIDLSYSRNIPVTNYLEEPYDKNYNYQIVSGIDTLQSLIFNGLSKDSSSFLNTSLFLQAFYVRNNSRIMGGIRWDNNERYGSNINPRIAVLHRFNKKTSVKASLGFAYKAPPTSYSHENIAIPAGQNLDSILYLVIPNKDLKPEKYRSIELGIGHRLFKRIHHDFTVYLNQVSNYFIDSSVSITGTGLQLAVNHPLNDPVRRIDNVEDGKKVLVFGANSRLVWNNIIPSIKLDAILSLSYLHQEKKDIESLIDNIELQPSHFGQFQLSMGPTKKIYTNLLAFWESKWDDSVFSGELYSGFFKELRGFIAVDLLIGYNLSRNLNLFVKGINIFNAKYGGLNATYTNEDLPYNPQLGKQFRLGLNYYLN